MADSKLSALLASAPLTVPSADDAIYVVDDPLGTPASKATTFANFNKARAFIGCSVYRGTSDQSISSATGTAVQFNTENFDTDGFHDNVTNNTRLTAPSDGYYQVQATVAFASNTTGYRAAWMTKNGTDSNPLKANYMVPIFQLVTGDTPVLPTPAYIFSLVAGDYIEIVAYQNSGGSLNVLQNYTGARIQRVGV